MGRAEIVLRLVGGTEALPPFDPAGEVELPAALARTIDAGRLVACRWCATAVPSRPDDDGWGCCDACAEGSARWGARWPLAAWLAIEAPHDASEVILAAAEALRVPAYADVPPKGRRSGTPVPVATPERPRRAWSHLEVVAAARQDADCFEWHHPDPTRKGRRAYVRAEELPEWPTVADVIGAEVERVTRVLRRAELVPGPCDYCGQALAPRERWRVNPDGRSCCGSCPVDGRSDRQDRDRMVSVLLGRPGTLSGVAELAGASPLWWCEHEPRPEPSDEPWGWLDPAEVERWQDTYERSSWERTTSITVRMAAAKRAEQEEASAQRIAARAVELVEDTP